MERISPSQEVNTVDYLWAETSLGDCHTIRKSAQGAHIYCDEKFARDVATARDLFIETLVKNNPSSSSCKNGFRRCNPTSGYDSSPSEPHKTTLHERSSDDVKESNSDADRMPKTKPRVTSKRSSSTQTGNAERLRHSWWTSIYDWMSSSSRLSAMFAMLMVGDDMHSPPRANQGPRIYLTSPGGHERRLSPLSPPKPPIRSPRESIERIKAFPKIPKRQFTTPEKSPEKKSPLGAWNNRSPTSASERIPCGGFRLLSPSKARRPPRDPFAIPEKFEPVRSSQSFDFSQEPEVVLFPSLMFKLLPSEEAQDGDKDVSKPSSSKDASQPSKGVCHQQEPILPGAADNPSNSPEIDNLAPESLSNPKSEDFPHRSTPIIKGDSSDQDELGVSDCQLNESDRLQQQIQDAMNEFDNVYGKYTSNLDDKIDEKLEQMEDFVSKVRRRLIRVTDFGAIVSTMFIPDEVTRAMARINKAIDKLKLLKAVLDVKYTRIYSVYINLKYKPLATYQSEKETSRLDDLNALITATKELKDMLTEVTKIIDSYRDDKKYVNKYVFGEK